MTRTTPTTVSSRRVIALRTLLSASLLAGLGAGALHAEPGRDGPPGPPPPPAPSAEELATIPALTTQQQVELRKILLERRDAHESLHAKTRDLMEAQHRKDRLEDERIDEASSERVRKLLGDEGFRSYAQWQLTHRGPRGRGDGPEAGPGPRGPRGGMPGEGPDPARPAGTRPAPGGPGVASAPPVPAPPDADAAPAR